MAAHVHVHGKASEIFLGDESGDADLIGGLGGNAGARVTAPSTSKFKNDQRVLHGGRGNDRQGIPRLYAKTSDEQEIPDMYREAERAQYEFVARDQRERQGTAGTQISSIKQHPNDSLNYRDLLSGTMSDAMRENQQLSKLLGSRRTTDKITNDHQRQPSQDANESGGFIAALSGLIDNKLGHGLDKLVQTNQALHQQYQDEIKSMRMQQQDLINRSIASAAYPPQSPIQIS